MMVNGFSAVFPVKEIVYISFLLIISPVQIFIFAIGYREVGFEYINRIYGEYKRNFTISIFDRYDFLYNLFAAGFDAALFLLLIW
jgi:hypothetical protein